MASESSSLAPMDWAKQGLAIGDSGRGMMRAGVWEGEVLLGVRCEMGIAPLVAMQSIATGGMVIFIEQGEERLGLSERELEMA